MFPNLGVTELVIFPIALFVLAVVIAGIVAIIRLVFKLGSLAGSAADKKKAEAENLRLREEVARLKEAQG